MKVLTIEIKIGKRVYPIEVENEEEADKIKLSAQMINDNINKLKGNYVVTDYVDLLAMTALEIANKIDEAQAERKSTYRKMMDEELNELNNKLDDILNP